MVYRPKWSEAILDDLRSEFRDQFPQAPTAIIEEQISRIGAYEFGYDALERPHIFMPDVDHASTDVDPRALHALEVAARGGVDAVLTTHPKDYPEVITDDLEIVVQGVDDFMITHLEHRPAQVRLAFTQWVRQNQAVHDGPTSVAALLDRLECDVPHFAAGARSEFFSTITQNYF